MLAWLPSWVDPVARYILENGLKLTLEIWAVAVAGSAIVGIVLGPFLTIRFWPLRALVRLYVEVWRGLPIIVTIFLIYFSLPVFGHSPQLLAIRSGRAGAVGKRAGGRGDARGDPVDPREQHEAASALGFGWVGTQVFVIFPQALRRLLPPLVSLRGNVIQNSTLALLIGAGEVLATAQRETETLPGTPADRRRRRACGRT